MRDSVHEGRPFDRTESKNGDTIKQDDDDDDDSGHHQHPCVIL